MEIRAVRKDGYLRTLRAGGSQQLPVLAINSWDVGDHFHQAHHGQAMRIHYWLNAGFLHAWPRAAEELQIGPAAAQSFHQTRRIEVPGRFASRNQNFRAHYGLV
jgi:hypothetical protein